MHDLCALQFHTDVHFVHTANLFANLLVLCEALNYYWYPKML
jgi:hypothetical protein